MTLEHEMRPPYGIPAAWCQNISSPAVRLSFWLIKTGYVMVSSSLTTRGCRGGVAAVREAVTDPPLKRRDPLARKWCSGCKVEHPLSWFGWNRSAKDDRQHCCKEWRARRERELRNGAPPMRPWGRGGSMLSRARQAGVNVSTVYSRLRRGWSVERALGEAADRRYANKS